MPAHFRFPKALSHGLIAVLAVSLAACSTLTIGEKRVEESDVLRQAIDSDYDLLSCADLAVIETSALQRFGRLDASTENRAERELLLRAQIDEIVASRELKGCPVPRAAQEANLTPVSVSQATAAPAPAPQAAVSAPVVSPATNSTGRFLQIGTFDDPTNAEAAAEHFADQGYRVEIRNSFDGAFEQQRVLLGPLADDQAGLNASEAARRFGINDAFFIDG